MPLNRYSSIIGGTGAVAEKIVVGIGAERDGDRHSIVPGVLPLTKVLRPVVMHVDVQAGRVLVEDLQPIHADVGPPLEVVRHHERQRDEGTAILGPCGEHGQLAQVDVVALEHDLLARAPCDDLLGPAPARSLRPMRTSSLPFIEAGISRGSMSMRRCGDSVQIAARCPVSASTPSAQAMRS